MNELNSKYREMMAELLQFVTQPNYLDVLISQLLQHTVQPMVSKLLHFILATETSFGSTTFFLMKQVLIRILCPWQ
jgi:hypothetical protein